MGYEDADSERTVITADEPRSMPRTEAEQDLEMRNLPEPSRSRSPVDGLRRRLSRDPEIKKERQQQAEERRTQREVPVAVVEQRLSNLAQGCLCMFLPTLHLDSQDQADTAVFVLGLVLMTAPFQHVLGLIPKGVLAGLFVCPLVLSIRGRQEDCRRGTDDGI